MLNLACMPQIAHLGSRTSRGCRNPISGDGAKQSTSIIAVSEFVGNP